MKLAKFSNISRVCLIKELFYLRLLGMRLLLPCKSMLRASMAVFHLICM